MPEVTAEAIWEGLVNDPVFFNSDSCKTEEARNVFKDLVEAVLPKLAEHFDKKLTLVNFMTVKAAILEEVLENGWAEKTLATNPKALQWGLDSVVRQMHGVIQGQLLPLMNHIVEMSADFLRNNEITEEQALFHPKVCRLDRVVYARYKEGSLTIGETFLLHPNAFFDNTKN